MQFSVERPDGVTQSHSGPKPKLPRLCIPCQKIDPKAKKTAKTNKSAAPMAPRSVSRDHGHTGFMTALETGFPGRSLFGSGAFDLV